MYPQFEKDYQYLLSRLIPKRLLSSKRIEGIYDALTSNDRSKMITEAFLAMEELVSQGVFTRDAPVSSNGAVLLSYIQKDGKARYTLEMGREEWNSVNFEEKGKSGLVPSVLAGIITSLTLSESEGSITDKIEDILGMMENIYRDSRAYLILFREASISGMRESSVIREVSREKIESNRFYEDSIANGKIHTLINTDGILSENSLFRIGRGSGFVVQAPLFGNETKFGLLQIHLNGKTRPDDSALYNIYLIGQGIARLIENNRHMEELVSIDRLTGVNNRNFYETQLPLEMERASRDKKFLGFLIMDIDDFKKFNDDYGHDIGDEVLRTVARTVRKHLRKIDLFFRYGGEEFVALLPGAGRDAAERTAERIREIIFKTDMKLEDGNPLRITISIGGCVYPQDADNEKELFRKADQMLLDAKQLGKNRIRFYKGGGQKNF